MMTDDHVLMDLMVFMSRPRLLFSFGSTSSKSSSYPALFITMVARRRLIRLSDRRPQVGPNGEGTKAL